MTVKSSLVDANGDLAIARLDEHDVGLVDDKTDNVSCVDESILEHEVGQLAGRRDQQLLIDTCRWSC